MSLTQERIVSNWLGWIGIYVILAYAVLSPWPGWVALALLLLLWAGTLLSTLRLGRLVDSPTASVVAILPQLIAVGIVFLLLVGRLPDVAGYWMVVLLLLVLAAPAVWQVERRNVSAVHRYAASGLVLSATIASYAFTHMRVDLPLVQLLVLCAGILLHATTEQSRLVLVEHEERESAREGWVEVAKTYRPREAGETLSLLKVPSIAIGLLAVAISLATLLSQVFVRL